MSEADFAGKVVLVTGATSGIGRAAALMLARRGATVVAASRRAELGATLEEEAHGLPGTLRFRAADIADEGEVDALFADIEATHGRLDAALNNAGMESEHVAVPDTPVETFDRLFAVNVRGTWLCLRLEMRMMRAQGSGAIVNTASIAGLNGFPGASVYTASKHAIIGMTKAAGLELPHAGVRVNCLCPGATRSDMSARWSERVPGGEAAMAQRIPIRRLAEPEEQAEAAVFLLSDAASYITAAVLVADGGSSAI